MIEYNIECIKCGVIYRTPYKYSRQCKTCTSEAKIMDQFYEMVSCNNGCVVGNYSNSTTIIGIKCNICSKTWYDLPIHVIKSDWHTCDVKAKIINIIKNNGGELLSEYVDSTTKVTVRCGTCNMEFNATPYAIIYKGSWCSNCSRTNRMIKSHEKFRSIVEEKGGELLEDYKGSCIPINIRCGTCSNIWNVRPNTVISGSKCPHCPTNVRVKTKDKFFTILKKKGGELIGEYTNSCSNVSIKCNACTNIWSIIPSNVNRGTWCPTCTKNRRSAASSLLQFNK